MYDDIGREYERKQYGRYAFKFIRRAATITSIAALRKKIEYGETDLPADGGHFAKAGFDLLNSNTRGFIGEDNINYHDYIEEALENFDMALGEDFTDELAFRGLIECSERVLKRAIELNGGIEAKKCLERALAIDETNYKAWLEMHNHIGKNFVGFYEIYTETKYTGAESEKKIFHIRESDKAKEYLTKALLYAPESEKPCIKKLLDDRASISRTDVENIRKKAAIEEARIGWCYIATAVYGSYDAPETKILRRFRDEHLLINVPGRLLVKTYYFLSPPVANFLKNAKRINKYVKRVLDYIVHKLSD